MELQPNKLQDTLLEIIPLTEDDFESLYSIASDPMLWELHPVKDRYKKDVFRKFFREIMDMKGAFMVIDKNTQEVMGTSSFYDYDPENSQVAIGYTFLARKYWGGEYNGALKKLMLDYAFRSVEKVVFHIAVENLRSQKAVTKIGGKRTRELIRNELPYYEYEIGKGDWVK